MNKQIIDKYIDLVNDGLNQLSFPESPGSLYDPCTYILSNGGKRIRPVLTLIATGLTGGKIEKALSAALAIELVHNFTLVHDDIMDQAESRRGRPSIHIKWNQSTAILAGDVLFVHACKLLSTYISDPGFSQKQYQELNNTFFHAVQIVCEGQALDMDFELRDDLKTSEYLEMIKGKTGSLLSASLRIGGIIADADNEQLQDLSDLGMCTGLAFQIQDDLLDVIADPEKFGKPRGGDIREGKKTFLALLALERGNPSDRETLLQILSEKSNGDEDVHTAIELFQRYDVIESATELMNKYYSRAFKALNRFGDSNYKQDLDKLLNFLKNRDY